MSTTNIANISVRYLFTTNIANISERYLFTTNIASISERYLFTTNIASISERYMFPQILQISLKDICLPQILQVSLKDICLPQILQISLKDICLPCRLFWQWKSLFSIIKDTLLDYSLLSQQYRQILQIEEIGSSFIILNFNASERAIKIFLSKFEIFKNLPSTLSVIVRGLTFWNRTKYDKMKQNKISSLFSILF